MERGERGGRRGKRETKRKQERAAALLEPKRARVRMRIPPPNI